MGQSKSGNLANFFLTVLPDEQITWFENLTHRLKMAEFFHQDAGPFPHSLAMTEKQNRDPKFLDCPCIVICSPVDSPIDCIEYSLK